MLDPEASKSTVSTLEDQVFPRKPRSRRTLRTGFSTGTAAAAAARAALRELLGVAVPEMERVELPPGGSLDIPLAHHGMAGSRGEAVVVKDAGDDPDVTHGAEIGARVGFSSHSREALQLLGGEGVGRVTKPGLPLPVGEPAINPVPRLMVRAGLASVWRETGIPPRALTVEIFVPRGEELARHTLNPRLGILGGLSILGTTGLVRPFSHQAYRATIITALRVARALGLTQVVLTTGGKSEEFLKKHLPALPEEAFVQMGDYVAFALRAGVRLGFGHLTVGAFFGKALKIAQGFGQTHASRGLVNFQELGRTTQALTGNPLLARAVDQAHTAREVLEILPAGAREAVVGEVGRRMLEALRRHAGPVPELQAVILDFAGTVLFQGGERGQGS
jgi:cobalt-precorrin-5B (C1)-methyltransferase